MSKETSSKENATDLLLEIADAYSENASAGRVSDNKYLRSVLAILIENPVFKEFHLEERDILIIAILLGDFLDNEDGMDTRRLLKKIEREKRSFLREIHRINRLRESGILEIGRCQRYSTDRCAEDSREEDEDNLSSVGTLNSTVRISNILLRKLLDKGETLHLHRHDDIKPYKDNLEYLADQFMRLSLLKDDYYDDDFLINPDRLRRFRRDITRSNGNQYEYKLKMLEDSITARLSKTAQLFPLEELKKKGDLRMKLQGMIYLR